MKQKKTLKLTGSYIEQDGKEVAVDPKQIQSLANACAAANKTFETGQTWKVTA